MFLLQKEFMHMFFRDLENSSRWKKKSYSHPADGERVFGYQSHPFLEEEDIGISNSIMNFVRIEPGFWIPRHYHERKDEHFTVLKGEAAFYLRPDKDSAKEERVVYRSGDVFRVGPGVVHGTLNLGDDWFYLSRFALHSFPGDNHFTE